MTKPPEPVANKPNFARPQGIIMPPRGTLVRAVLIAEFRDHRASNDRQQRCHKGAALDDGTAPNGFYDPPFFSDPVSLAAAALCLC